jgi:hypothetical protein
MNSYKLIRSSLMWALVLALSALPAWAQSSNSAASGAPDKSSSPSVVSGQVGFQRRPQLTLEEEQTASEEMVSKIEQRATFVRRQLGLARQERDVVKTLCLSDKLSQLDVTSRAASERKEARKLAVSRNDKETRAHEFVMMSVLEQRSEQLIAESNQCVGEEASFVGTSQLQVTIDPVVETSDQTALPQTHIVGIDNGITPQTASGYY